MRPVSDARPAATLAFDRLAPEYDALVGGEIFQLLRRRTHRAFARRFPPASRVLEIGCGTGIDTSFLASRGIDVIACDPSEEMVSRSLRRLVRDGCESRTTVATSSASEPPTNTPTPWFCSNTQPRMITFARSPV